REGRRQARGDRLGEGQHLVAVRTDTDRHEDMEPLASRGLRTRHEAESVESLLHAKCRPDRVGELSGFRIQIEADPVRFSRTPRPASPHVHGDAAEIGQSELRLPASTHNIVGPTLLVAGVRGVSLGLWHYSGGEHSPESLEALSKR